MKFLLVFENSGDSIPFDVHYNQELLEFFVDHVQRQQQNSFSNNHRLFNNVNHKLNYLNQMLVEINDILPLLVGKEFEKKANIEEYLDQDFLNKTHCEWVHSQQSIVDIDQLRNSSNAEHKQLGMQLHNLYPDEIRFPRISDVLSKLNYIYSYEEINMAIHRLESSFINSNLEFSAQQKWEVFPNPFAKTMDTNNSSTNFCFGYTYLGRQYYDKFQNFDNDLTYDDHYNFETLEFSFQLNLKKPQTVEYSKEAIDWARQHNVKLVGTQIPIANIPDLNDRLFDYRKILYRNSQSNNRVSIILK